MTSRLYTSALKSLPEASPKCQFKKSFYVSCKPDQLPFLRGYQNREEKREEIFFRGFQEEYHQQYKNPYH